MTLFGVASLTKHQIQFLFISAINVYMNTLLTTTSKEASGNYEIIFAAYYIFSGFFVSQIQSEDAIGRKEFRGKRQSNCSTNRPIPKKKQ